MDSDFIQILNFQKTKFRRAVMRDYWLFRQTDHDNSGFSCLKTSTMEYRIQKHFEVRLEDYIRRYLVNGFMGRILESRGNGIYPCSLPEYIKTTSHFTTKEFETIVPYEFAADFIDSDKRTLVRYTDISIEEALYLTKDNDEIAMIHWDSFCKNDKESYTLENGKQIIHYCLKSFMSQHGFSDEEYGEYAQTLDLLVLEVQDLIGAKSIPKLNPAMLFAFRFEVENRLREHIALINTLKKGESTFGTDCRWAYHIIDDDNEQNFPNIEAETKSLLVDSGALDNYTKKELYKALIGTSDFARSFITSEYLYMQYDSSDMFDYTAIVSGYLKCVEQLLFCIELSAIDKGLKINGKVRKNDGSYKKGVIEFNGENYNRGDCDTTLGSLNTFLQNSKNYVVENSKDKSVLVSCLKCYIKECRNDSFHKHNIDKWSRVAYIRQNTLILIEILLGLCKENEKIGSFDSRLGIIRDDKFERVYNWIVSIKAESFYVRFPCELAKRAALGKISEYPSFDNHGFITDYTIPLECLDVDRGTSPKSPILFLKRDCLPVQMWYFDSNGNKIEFTV